MAFLLQSHKGAADDTYSNLCNGEDSLDFASETHRYSDDFDSTCSTPYVSAPSSPGRGVNNTTGGGYFFSAPASPMHYVTSSFADSSVFSSHQVDSSVTGSFEFEFSSRFSPNGKGVSSADELFLNGQIRPMKLSSHLQRPQILAPLVDLDKEDEEEEDDENMQKRGRDLKFRSRSLHRKARSLSPLRNATFEWHEEEEEKEEQKCKKEAAEAEEGEDSNESNKKQSVLESSETTPCGSASSSRSSSSGRNSKKWIFLKDLLYRSKSEGRGRSHEIKQKEKFWASISFHQIIKEKKINIMQSTNNVSQEQKQHKHSSNGNESRKKKKGSKKPANGVTAKRRVPPSAHELHYTTNRAQAEELKKRTFLPYRQGVLGCLGFSSKGYGALNGLARTLNPVSSR